MPKLHFLLQSRSDYLYKFKKFPKDTASMHLPGICHSTGFPLWWRHLHRNRKVQIQAYSGHKGNCTSFSCIWMHFSLLRDENITSSFYSFMHILLHFFAFLTNSLGQFWKCLKFLKKMKGNKKKMKESENVHFKLLPLCPPKLFSNWYFLFGCEITDSQWDFPVLHQTFLSGCIPCMSGYKQYKFHPKVQVQDYFHVNDQIWFCPSFIRKLHSMHLHLHKSTKSPRLQLSGC